MNNKDKLLRMSELAYDLGFNQESKTNITKIYLAEKVRCFVVRNGYMPMLWAAYKAGRFAKKNGDL